MIRNFQTTALQIVHSAIPDGRTWSNLGKPGEHEEHIEHGKDGNQPDDCNNTLYL